MAWFSKTTDAGDREARAAADKRLGEWQAAIAGDAVPDFVVKRLDDARAGRAPWVATMTPAELLLSRSHGIRPIAMVSGTCWFHHGRSWTEGHATGWGKALKRIRGEAVEAGANAVVDVRMRTLAQDIPGSMDFTLFGTAVRIEGLPPTPDPVIATVPALEFVRLLENGIVPSGIAVGAEYGFLDGLYVPQPSVLMGNQSLTELSRFWENIRRRAHRGLREDAAGMGDGVLAHVQFGQLLTRERDKQPPLYLGRHIVIGTVVRTARGEPVRAPVRTVVDMRDDLSPLTTEGLSRHNSYGGDGDEQEGAI